MIEILDPGPLCTVQDSGRRGWAHLGVGHSGAADRWSYALANRLVGNLADAAVLECTFGGAWIRLTSASLLATAGAECTINVVGGPPIAHQQPVAVPAGATIALSAPRSDLRTYIAIRGGIDVAPVMGSRSTDVLSGVGPAPLRAGDMLPIGPDPQTPVPTVAAPPRAPLSAPITIWPGPRFDWFTAEAIAHLVSNSYDVMSSSNRIGARLAGPSLTKSVTHELPSEGLVEGAIQVPTDGQPLIFLADHGTTGGYPVIAVVDPADVARIAQARPGHALTFRWR